MLKVNTSSRFMLYKHQRR